MITVILWMIGTLTSFCLMAVSARELTGSIDTFQILFFRSLIGLLVISLIIYQSKRFHLFSTKHIKLHIGRNLFHYAGQYGWFLGIALLPLAEVFALEFTVPFWTILIAAVFLNEVLSLKKVFAVLLGLLGVVIILKPGAELFDVASLIVLAAAISYAFTHVATKALSNTEDSLTVLFYMCLIQLPIGLLLTLDHWVLPNLAQSLWLSVIGLTALTAHYCMTNAMKIAEAGVVVTLDFFRLPLIGIVGILFYNEAFDMALIIGASLMLLGNLINIYQAKSMSVPAPNR